MPSIIQVVEPDDPVIPSKDQIQKALKKSHDRWQQYIKQATDQPSVLLDCLDLGDLIDRIPAVPTGRLRINGRTVFGQSTWKFKPQDECSLEDFTSNLRPMTLGITSPTTCTTEGSSFRHWREDAIENPEPGNCLAILMFAWAYILSARLVELQGGSLRYTETLAPIVDGILEHQAASRDVVLDTGDTDSAAVRWWRAILARGQGWHATVQENPAFLSPWSISYQGSQCLKVNLPPGASVDHYLTSGTPCPSSSQAVSYLAGFCALYHLHSQSSAARAAALVLPLHNYLRQEAVMPKILLVKSPDTPTTKLDFFKEEHELPYLMTLSCTARMLDSAIWGVFWEPGIPCNLVSAWFRPILDSLTPIIKSGNFELLAKVMAVRRPKLSPLWIGSILTSLTPSRIIPFLENLEGTLSGPDSDVAAWTSSPQSFMDMMGSGPYVQLSKIQRADVWRLRYDCQNEYPPPTPYRNPPLTGWPPFGSVPHNFVDLEIWPHTSCTRHEREYSHWNWIMADGTRLVDHGFSNKSGVICGISHIDVDVLDYDEPEPRESQSLDINFNVSEEATRGAFVWAIDAGHNPEIDGVFTHPWLLWDHGDDSDSSSTADSVGPKETSNYNFSIGRFLEESDPAQGNGVDAIERTRVC